jgi:hypothetical protein
MYKKMYTKLVLFLLVALALCNPIFAKNPIVPNVGLNDPHGFKQGRHGSFFEWHKQWYFALGWAAEKNKNYSEAMLRRRQRYTCQAQAVQCRAIPPNYF